ncbi:MAG TPA: hypothetical protein ENG42_00820 [Candidatus Aenigmarchaeota archaeon]|nr:MAG: hypothetical protein DRP03_01415 [Candidatus Aenigmarchaeota archaeon]HDD45993.1 hypothetical protein [Candidatus Aenigmarchaeota archaeon]
MNGEEKILELLRSEYSWEQVIYQIIGWEGLNPWDIDIVKLTNAFLRYLERLKEMDFKIPAKYVLVAAVLLKMKSEYLRSFKEQLEEGKEEVEEAEIEAFEEELFDEEGMEITPITMPPKRVPVRKIVVNDLVKALKKVIETSERRKRRIQDMRKNIRIEREDINLRIKLLYEKITNILEKIKGKEIGFSRIVDRWEREEIVNNFIPLIHLDAQQKITCWQKEFFDEIWIKKR